MHANFRKNIRFFWHKNAVTFLAISVISGLLFGIFTAWHAEDLQSVVRESANADASIFWLLTVLLTPLFLSVLAVYFSAPAAVLPVCFFKAFAFGFCSCAVLVSYSDAGWLIRSLLLFSDSVILLPMLWFWLRHIDGTQTDLRRDALLCLSIVLLVAAIDFVYITPFLASLL